ncbi:DUF4145 domain-containing protein [Pseudomonas sp. Bc-h]|uniref:DUF4145 domain-containing protein n=1 Tax=Pseudomonas sp. Bc-h TaxID=1943632 RepID=UPI001E2F22F2|nr:DUF4145 domain-containing protein [Pseudomonas sp. Bc-h]
MSFRKNAKGSHMALITKTFDITLDEMTEKFPCKKCCLRSNHKIVATYTERGSEDCGGGNSVEWTVHNQIIQCLGCEEISFRVDSSNSEDWDHDEYGDAYWVSTVTFYPGRVVGSKIIDHESLPLDIEDIYRETRSALDNDLLIISGIGIRTILDTICSDVKAKGRNLEQKIDDLNARSLVTEEGVQTLHKIRVLGNHAAHRGKAPTKNQLLLALEVIEHILIGTYIIPYRAKKVFKNLEAKKALPPPEQN